MHKSTPFLILACCATAGLHAADSATPSEPAVTDIADTQLTLRVGRVQGQATVVGCADNRITVVTVAHFLADDDVDRTVMIRRRDDVLVGRVVAVTRNPHFGVGAHGGQSGSATNTIGVDTAVAVIRAEARTVAERRILEAIRVAELTASPFPAGANQIVPVHIVDQFGDEHVVRAGNHLNPKCLAWGRSTYAPVHGDSGAGVFIVRRSARGELRPVLIGSVCQTDARGGIASLTYRSATWIERALDSMPAGPEPRMTSRHFTKN